MGTQPTQILLSSWADTPDEPRGFPRKDQQASGNPKIPRGNTRRNRHASQTSDVGNLHSLQQAHLPNASRKLLPPLPAAFPAPRGPQPNELRRAAMTTQHAHLPQRSLIGQPNPMMVNGVKFKCIAVVGRPTMTAPGTFHVVGGNCSFPRSNSKVRPAKFKASSRTSVGMSCDRESTTGRLTCGYASLATELGEGQSNQPLSGSANRYKEHGFINQRTTGESKW